MEKVKKQKDDIGFLFNQLALGPEIRGEEPKGTYPKGRIKQVFAVFSAEMNNLMRVNCWTLLFTIPLFFIVYWYSNFAANSAIQGFNFMGNVGMAYPGGSDDAVQGLIAVYKAYQNVLYFTVPALMIMSIGISGSFNCYKAYMWGEKMPKVTKPFFKGVKNYWWKYLIVVTVDAGIILATGSTVLYFLQMKALGQATAGIWTMLIFVCIFAFLLLYVNMQLLPLLCEVELSFGKQIKDAIILSIKYALIGIPVFIVCLIPVCLFFVNNTFLTLILVVLIMMFGLIIYGLIFTGMSQNALDNVLTPLYRMSQNGDKQVKQPKQKIKNMPKEIPAEKPSKPVVKAKKEIVKEEIAEVETVEDKPTAKPAKKNVNYSSNYKSKGKKNGGK